MKKPTTIVIDLLQQLFLKMEYDLAMVYCFFIFNYWYFCFIWFQDYSCVIRHKELINQISIMILSALLTSVGINLGFCFIFFTLYSILRKQPGNIVVYAPRLVSERKLQEGEQFNLERLLPTAGWVRRAWETSEDDFLSTAGLDAFVFMRIFVFRWFELLNLF